MICNKRELSGIFNVSERTLTEYLGEGLPVHQRAARRGQSHQFDTGAVHRWLLDREIGKRIDSAGDEVLDLASERAKLARAQRIKIEHELALLDRETVSTQEVEEVWTTMILNCRARLLAIPNRAAPLVAGLTNPKEAAALLEKMVHEALQELSDSTFGLAQRIEAEEEPSDAA